VARRHEDPRAEVGEEVRVGVRVGPVKFKLNSPLWARPDAAANPAGSAD